MTNASHYQLHTNTLSDTEQECNRGEIKVDNSTDIDIDIIDIVHFHRKYHHQLSLIHI